jgi:glycosyltransferase involved in cell wall biosynthesis
VKYQVAFVSVVPSPYQRDLFQALASRPDVGLSVFYLEAASPDSPWPRKPLESYEKVLRGFWFGISPMRCHLNWPLPDLDRFDIVVMNSLVSLTAQWLMRTRLRNKPWIFWGERLGRRGPLRRQMVAPLHRATAIASIGGFALDDYRERFPEPRHFCIPYHCDLAPFLATARRGRDDGRIVFLFCGQMIARKGVDLLLAAFQKLGTNTFLLLVGREAELPALLAGIPKENRDRIIYAGFQPPDELPRYFSQADVFVLPSRYDGWGVVVNQALGAGLPIVCSDMVGAGHDLVEDGVNGLKFRANDATALTKQLQRIVGTPELIGPWGEASRRKAAAWFPANGAQKWIEAFQAVLGR